MKRLLILAALAACSGSPTAPAAPADATVQHSANRQTTAIGLTRIGGTIAEGYAHAELWAVFINYDEFRPQPGPRTTLEFQRQAWLTGSILEDFQTRIPDADFTSGRGLPVWELHTDVPGRGRIDVAFVNDGNWDHSRVPDPASRFVVLTGNDWIQADGPLAGNFTGTIFGTEVAHDEIVAQEYGFRVLALSENTLVVRTP